MLFTKAMLLRKDYIDDDSCNDFLDKLDTICSENKDTWTIKDDE